MRCARIITPGLRKEFARERGGNNPQLRYEGHHPPCSGFRSHVVTISSRKYCAGCTGLALGALLSLVGIALLLGSLNYLPFAVLFWLGFALVLIAQFQHLLPVSGSIRLVISLGFSFGAFLMLAGGDGLVSSAFLDFYCLSLIVFLIISRTMISRESHAMVCSSCRLERCVLYD